MTSEILDSIKIRDRLYRKLKSTCPDSAEYATLEKNLKEFCGILKKSIRAAKCLYYHTQLENCKSDIKKKNLG